MPVQLQDTIELDAWMKECCRFSMLARARTRDLHQSFVDYQERSGRRYSVTLNMFSRMMQAKGFGRVKVNGSYLVGVWLKPVDQRDARPAEATTPAVDQL
jgi:hypothetical protein